MEERVATHERYSPDRVKAFWSKFKDGGKMLYRPVIRSNRRYTATMLSRAGCLIVTESLSTAGWSLDDAIQYMLKN